MCTSIIGILGTLFGVLVGALLTPFVENLKGRYASKRSKNLIKEELRSNLAMIPQTRDILVKMKNALTKEQVLSGNSVSFPTVAFDEFFKLAFPKLNALERNSLHFIYEKLKITDKFMDEFEERFILENERNVIPDIFSKFLNDILEITANIDVIEKLIDKHLKNDPVDVLYINRKTKPAKYK